MTKEEGKKMGIYCITCIDNGYKYVGSTTRFFKKRYSEHINILIRNEHHSGILQNCFNKYGKDRLIFEILEICSKGDNIILKEQFWMDKLQPKCNVCKIAGSLKYRPTSEASRKKMSESKRGIKGENHACWIRFSEDQKTNIIKDYENGINIGQLSIKYEVSRLIIRNRFKEWGIKLRNAGQSRYFFIEKKEKIKRRNIGARGILVKDNITGIVYGSLLDATKKLGLNYNTTKAQLRGQNPNKTSLCYLN